MAVETTEQRVVQIFAEHQIEARPNRDYLVPSSNGKRTYTVRFEGSPETMVPEVNTWSCTCRAGQFGKTCNHINQVAAANDAVCDEFGYE